MKNLIKSLIKNLIGGIIGCVLVLGFFYILGLIAQVVEYHLWLIIPLGIYVMYLIFKEI